MKGKNKWADVISIPTSHYLQAQNHDLARTLIRCSAYSIDVAVNVDLDDDVEVDVDINTSTPMLTLTSKSSSTSMLLSLIHI